MLRKHNLLGGDNKNAWKPMDWYLLPEWNESCFVDKIIDDPVYICTEVSVVRTVNDVINFLVQLITFLSM